jgi:hypothetical protein
MLNERTKSKTTTQEQDIPEDIKSIKPEIQSAERMDASLVQITASKAEIDRRIAAFLRKKQLDVDIHNQREFCNLLNTENGQHCLVYTNIIKKLFSLIFFVHYTVNLV